MVEKITLSKDYDIGVFTSIIKMLTHRTVEKVYVISRSTDTDPTSILDYDLQLDLDNGYIGAFYKNDNKWVLELNGNEIRSFSKMEYEIFRPFKSLSLEESNNRLTELEGIYNKILKSPDVTTEFVSFLKELLTNFYVRTQMGFVAKVMPKPDSDGITKPIKLKAISKVFKNTYLYDKPVFNVIIPDKVNLDHMLIFNIVLN